MKAARQLAIEHPRQEGTEAMTDTTALTANSSDDALRHAAQARPGMIRELCLEASRADEAIGKSQVGRDGLGIAGFWINVQGQISALQPRDQAGWVAPAVQTEAKAAQLRLALHARDLLVPVASDLPKIGPFEADAMSSRNAAPGDLARVRRAVMEKHPGLAALLAWQDAKADEFEAAQRREQERQAAVNEAQRVADRQAAARALVKRLAGQGVTLAASDKGVTARPVALLDAADAAEIARLRPELIDLLAAPAGLVA